MARPPAARSVSAARREATDEQMDWMRFAGEEQSIYYRRALYRTVRRGCVVQLSS
ncbi:hypothetical protein M9458_031206, partial [Cirrhinus mrigala]